MTLALIIAGAILLVFLIVRSLFYENSKRHGRCPICGAPIIKNKDGYYCSECNWHEHIEED